jgi:acetoin utilization protein AcuB
MASILSSYHRIQKGYRKVYIRMYGIERSKLPELEKELKEKATLLYAVDHRESEREIYEAKDFEVSAEEAA